MPIHYECSSCGAEMSIKDDRAGTSAKCPQCKEPFIVPWPEGETREGDDASVASAGETVTVSVESDTALAPPADSSSRDDPDGDEVLRLDPTDEEPDGDPVPSSDLATSKRSRGGGPKTAAPDDDDELLSERPKHTSRRERSSLVSASSTAGDLLKTHKIEETAKRKASAADPYSFAEKPENREEIKPDLVETLKYVGRSFLLPVLGVVAACILLYWASTSMLKTRKLPELGTVSGVVTLDGKPLANADVEFHPTEGLTAGVLKASSFARTDAQGRYTLIYLQDVAGAVTGEHHVRIRAPTGQPRLPDHYDGRSKLKCDVQPGKNVQNWDLTLAKEK